MGRSSAAVRCPSGAPTAAQLVFRSARPPARWSLSRLWIMHSKRHWARAAVLDGVDLAEYGFDDRLASAVDLAALLGFELARHPLLGGGVLGDRAARRRRRGF